MTSDELGDQIRSYIESHNICHLAVTDGERPSSHTVYYVSSGFRLYFESDPDSQKIHIIQANPNVSLTVDEDYADWREIMGVQMFGRARIVDETKAKPVREKFMRKFPAIDEYGGLPPHHVFVEVIPEKIYFLDFTRGFGHRSLYYPDEKAGKTRIKW